MKKRLEELLILLEELKNYSFGDQYGIADSNNINLMDKLAKESALYQETIKQIKILQT